MLPNSCTHVQLARVYTCSIFFSETNWDILQTIYQHPRHIDLFVGGLAEDQIDGGQVGQVFANIIAMQFKNLMDGDRYQNVLSVYFVAQKNNIKLLTTINEFMNIFFTTLGFSLRTRIPIKTLSFLDVQLTAFFNVSFQM